MYWTFYWIVMNKFKAFVCVICLFTLFLIGQFQIWPAMQVFLKQLLRKFTSIILRANGAQNFFLLLHDTSSFSLFWHIIITFISYDICCQILSVLLASVPYISCCDDIFCSSQDIPMCQSNEVCDNSTVSCRSK